MNNSNATVVERLYSELINTLEANSKNAQIEDLGPEGEDLLREVARRYAQWVVRQPADVADNPIGADGGFRDEHAKAISKIAEQVLGEHQKSIVTETNEAA